MQVQGIRFDIDDLYRSFMVMACGDSFDAQTFTELETRPITEAIHILSLFNEVVAKRNRASQKDAIALPLDNEWEPVDTP